MTNESNGDLSLTREELYNRVWAEPMWTLASHFGLSDVGLAKTCRRHRIPVPPRGYWQQKQAGQGVKPTKLPKLAVALSEKLGTITFQRRIVTTGVSAVEGERDVPTIPVADVLTDPHPLVAHTILALRRAKPARNGMLPRSASADYLDVRVSLGTVDRTMRIMDALARACDERGYTIGVRITEKEAISQVEVDGEVIPFHVEEGTDSVVIPPEERRPVRVGSWETPPQKKDVPNGSLGFYIDANWYWYQANVRRSWRDGKRQRLEDCLGHIVVGLEAAAVAVKASRAESEARDRRFREEARRRKYQAWLALCDKRRREVIEDDLKSLRLVSELRSYIALRRHHAPEPSEVLEEWLTWISEYADSVEREVLEHAGPKLEAFDENSYYY